MKSGKICYRIALFYNLFALKAWNSEPCPSHSRGKWLGVQGAEPPHHKITIIFIGVIDFRKRNGIISSYDGPGRNKWGLTNFCTSPCLCCFAIQEITVPLFYGQSRPRMIEPDQFQLETAIPQSKGTIAELLFAERDAKMTSGRLLWRTQKRRKRLKRTDGSLLSTIQSQLGLMLRFECEWYLQTLWKVYICEYTFMWIFHYLLIFTRLKVSRKRRFSEGLLAGEFEPTSQGYIC